MTKGLRNNPLKCIMANAKDQMTYFENMSQAYAMKAHNMATVLHRNIDNPPMDGIWARKELPILQAAGNPGGIVDYVSSNTSPRHRVKPLISSFRLPLLNMALIAGKWSGIDSALAD
jgi:hypothetical protein